MKLNHCASFKAYKYIIFVTWFHVWCTQEDQENWNFHPVWGHALWHDNSFGEATPLLYAHSTPLCPLHSSMPPTPTDLTFLNEMLQTNPALRDWFFIFFYFLNIYYSFTAYFSFVFLYCRFFWGYFYFLPSPPPHQHAGRRWVLEVTPCALRRRSIRNYVADTDRMQRDKTSNATGAEK